MLSGELCDDCKRVFGPDQLDRVPCDGCEGVFHRYACGQYVLVDRAGQKTAYFFCKDCES